MSFQHLSRRQAAGLSVGVLLLGALASWWVLKVVSPAPPRTLIMSSGAADGAYHRFATQYRQYLAANGVTLDIRGSSGSVENLQRLQGGQVDVALVQGGLGPLSRADRDDDDTGDLRSLATVAYEPLWLFSRDARLATDPARLARLRVAIGPTGSGTRKVALDLLALYGLNPDSGLLLPDGGLAAAEKLLHNEVDAVILIAAPQAPAVARLLAAPGVHLASLEQATGLARRLPYLQTITLPRGTVNPAARLPATDITLLATTANLVVNDALHPALAYLLLEAAQQTHRGPGLLHAPGTFPSAKGGDFVLADEAERYFRNGRPFLQRYLPFWMANFVQRAVLVIIPLLALLVPLFKILPPLLGWRQRRRLLRHYGELKFIEHDLQQRQLDAPESARVLERLDRMALDVGQARFPLDFADRVYTLRQHVDFVRSRVRLQSATHDGPQKPLENPDACLSGGPA